MIGNEILRVTSVVELAIVKQSISVGVHIQEVCNQYWPSSGSQSYGEFTVELLGEERLQGFVLRTVSVQNAKVSLRGWLDMQLVTDRCPVFPCSLVRHSR